MTEVEKLWADFEKIGIEQVRRNLAGHVYGEERSKAALGWIDHQASKSESLDRASVIALAREANDLAREAIEAAREANRVASDSATSSRAANELARAANSRVAMAEASSDQRTRTSNRIAALALITAIAAAIISIIQTIHGWKIG